MAAENSLLAAEKGATTFPFYESWAHGSESALWEDPSRLGESSRHLHQGFLVRKPTSLVNHVFGRALLLRTPLDLTLRLQQKRRTPVKTDEGETLARELGAYKYIECSALTQQGLKGVFDDAIRCVLDMQRKPKKKKAKCTLL